MEMMQEDLSEPNWDEVFNSECKKIDIKSDSNDISTIPMTAHLNTEDEKMSADQSKQVEIHLNNEEPLLNFPLVSPKKSKSGSKCSKPKSKKKDNILRLFISAKKVRRGKKSTSASNESLEPKKEYYRVKLIRGHKRIIRDILENKNPPTKTINKLKKGCSKHLKAYNQLCLFVREHWMSLVPISKTSSGPLTDGECFFRKTFGKDYKQTIKGHKTFNNSFCDEYFSNQAVKRSYELYIDYLYAGQTSMDLGKKFEFICCNNNVCSCLGKKWKRLQKYSKEKLIECPKESEVKEEDTQKERFFNDEDNYEVII